MQGLRLSDDVNDFVALIPLHVLVFLFFNALLTYVLSIVDQFLAIFGPRMRSYIVKFVFSIKKSNASKLVHTCVSALQSVEFTFAYILFKKKKE